MTAVIASDNDIEVRDLVLDTPKVQWLWQKFLAHKTVFTDLTRHDYQNFMRMLLQPGSLWFEFVENNEVIGVASVMDIEMIVDGNVHIIFFDRKVSGRVEVCRKLLIYVMREYSFHRLTATLPEIFKATIRLLKELEFRHEGTKIEAVPIGGRWHNMAIYGILRSQVEAWNGWQD